MAPREVLLRKTVRGLLPEALWVEANFGGSDGLPDCYWPVGDGRAIWLELKRAERRKKDGCWAWSFTKNQPGVIRRLLAAGLPVVGVAGGPAGLVWVAPGEEFLTGEALTGGGLVGRWIDPEEGFRGEVLRCAGF